MNHQLIRLDRVNVLTDLDNGIDSRSDKAMSGSVRVWNLMLLILASALWMGLVQRHMEENTLKFRFAAGAPISVKTRLYLGHFMSSSGLVFGGCQLALLFVRKEFARVTFGTFGWAICGFYLIFQISSSILWSTIHQFIRSVTGGGVFSFSVLERVILLSSHQACFDEFAWLLAALWAAAWLIGKMELSELPAGLIARMQPDRSDVSFAFYSSFVVLATIFQRVLEATGM
jgi:hypothetical protein